MIIPYWTTKFFGNFILEVIYKNQILKTRQTPLKSVLKYNINLKIDFKMLDNGVTYSRCYLIGADII